MSQPLSPDLSVTNPDKFRDVGLLKLGYRVLVSNTSLERAVVAKGINRPPHEVVVCQCDGTARQVDTCLMGLKIREGQVKRFSPEGTLLQTPILPTDIDLERHPHALVSVRAQCNKQAHDTLLDFQGAM